MEGINTEVAYQDLASLGKGKKDILMLIAQHTANIGTQK